MNKDWWIGRLAGILLGISKRKDVPQEIKEMIGRVLAELDDEQDLTK